MSGVFKTPSVTAERIKQYLKEGKRFDGRKPEEFRDIQVEFGVSKKAEGSVRVKLGKTEVIAGVKMQVSQPYSDSPDCGTMMVTAELLPLSSPRYESGPPKIEAIELGRVIDRGIRESGVIDFKKLCIAEGEKVWTVFIDIFSINADGNLLDAAGLAAILALANAEMPKYDAEEGKVLYGESTGEKLPLAKEIPIAITVHKIGDVLVVDPTREEEDLTDTRITIGSSNGSISSMQKGEAKGLSIEEMEKVIDLSLKTEREIFKKIEKHLK